MKPPRKSGTPASRRRKPSDPWATSGQLAAAMAHEVNNSLDTMQNCLHLLDRRVHPVGEEAYQLLRTEAARLTRLVREILGLYRGPQSSRPTDFNTVVTQTVQSLQPRLHDGKVHVSTSMDRLPRISVSPVQLRMVVSNLIVNAADAMPEGGKLRIETRQLKSKSHVCLRVVDAGVVAQIVAHNGGRIRALPRKGGGSIFEVEFPLREPAPKRRARKVRTKS